jgi:hypothetical protein
VIVGVHAIAVQLLKIGEALLDVVECVRPLRVTRELRDLPGRQAREDATRERLALVLEARDLFTDVELGILADEFKSVDACFELGDRLFKLQEFQIDSPWATSDARTLPCPSFA